MDEGCTWNYLLDLEILSSCHLDRSAGKRWCATGIFGAEWRDAVSGSPSRPLSRSSSPLQQFGARLEARWKAIHFDEFFRRLWVVATGDLGRTPCSRMAKETSSGSLHSALKRFRDGKLSPRSGRDDRRATNKPMGSSVFADYN